MIIVYHYFILILPGFFIFILRYYYDVNLCMVKKSKKSRYFLSVNCNVYSVKVLAFSHQKNQYCIFCQLTDFDPIRGGRRKKSITKNHTPKISPQAKTTRPPYPPRPVVHTGGSFFHLKKSKGRAWRLNER